MNLLGAEIPDALSASGGFMDFFLFDQVVCIIEN